jgi:alkanesulfonate monooxygenase SsuD/methylene tetrahydromethanopterin reductase-like flavin-dependent oxidoreductase (luciferase family)
MKFGYFTLSDNYYRNNTRAPNDFIRQITEQAVYAETLGMHSAWIGEHHFSTLGVLSCPDLVLANVAAQTKNIRLAPAVTVLPMHHPIHVAEQWATLDLLSDGRVDWATGRGYDRREYEPFGADFDNNQEVFAEGLEIVRRLWSNEGPYSHEGKHFKFRDMLITPQPVQQPIPIYVASFSKSSIDLAARMGLNLIVAPFAVAMAFGGLANVTKFFNEACAANGKPAGKVKCSYFIHFADTPEEEMEARKRQLRYFQECVIDALPSNPATTPPTYRYFNSMVENLKKMRPEDLTENSVLIGNSARITEILKKVEAAGFEEVILYFNVGLKPHQQVKDEMARFMAEVAPNFA